MKVARRHAATLRAALIRRRPDNGSGTIWAMAIVVVLLLLGGAVLDGGNAMVAHMKALDLAQEAARAGANQIDLAALRNQGVVRLDPARAQAAAQQFLGHAEVTGTATATTQQVTVTVTRNQPTLIIQVLGITTIPVSATAQAIAQTGP
ncbi:pilus assembly protein TadG-related protein [Rugosimonospora africana]|uniref:Membrane protein n=1 Tax=Rugosimonospora africana TaxID=556532 RepID=A0A8J3VRE6_9ACTN|nr:pilus assembly protein TadG-related protein [Rugosimonospora africana]GIH16105.1 membrane protein [Rugosimonospora africana]